jgi:hypothetical protein
MNTKKAQSTQRRGKYHTIYFLVTSPGGGAQASRVTILNISFTRLLFQDIKHLVI